MIISDELIYKIIFALEANFHKYTYSGCNAEYGACGACDKDDIFIKPVLEELEKITRNKIKPFMYCPGFEPCNLQYGHRGKHMIIAG